MATATETNTSLMMVLTLAEAAVYLRVSEEALQRLAVEQEVPARKVGGEWRFLRSALDRWLQGQRAEPRWPETPFWPGPAFLEELLCVVEHRLLAKLKPPQRVRPEPGSKEQLSASAGIWKDDPTVEEMLREIYKRRGRPMTEGEE